ncbi:MAG: hypothetical protein K8R68_09950, partial [Bacteroidales bacterium]|nr:hypothetical protein [Bacteroidales bacterium]
MKKLLLCFFLLSNLVLYSQDTLKIMHYNLLNYGNFWGGCTTSNNNVDDKNNYLKTIINYVKPDIFTVNEISSTVSFQEYLMYGALNVDGINYYQMGDPSNQANSSIINQIYYNSEKISMHSNVGIYTYPRDIDIFKLYYNPVNKNPTGDTVFLYCVVAHLKAGQGYETARANATGELMNYLSNSSASGNYLFMGDFNIYTGSEQAFQNLLFHPNQEIRFYDPLNQIGPWHENDYYPSVLTQSTQVSGDCPSGGGLDDRFDFILASDEIINGTNQIIYIPGSYWALGQDGLHFNNALLDSPTNTSVPIGVLNSLFHMSDHLPVVMELKIDNN